MEEETEENALPYELGKFSVVSFSVQMIFCLLFAIFVDYDVEANGSHFNNQYDPILGGQRPLENSIYVKYPAYSDVHVAVLLGFGFLLTFIKRYSYCSVGLSFFLAAILVQWAILCDGFFNLEDRKILLSIDDFLEADMAVMAGLIAWGAVLGKLSPLQLLVMALLQVPFHSTLKYLIGHVFQAIDHGCSMSCHVFSSLYGLAISVIIYKKEQKKRQLKLRCDYLDIFSTIGTLILWIYWPNLNATTVIGDDKHRAIINTYLALVASCVMTFAITSLIHPQSRFSVNYIQNATLSGGIAIGATCGTMLGPYAALIIGSLAAIFSTTSAHYLSPILSKLRVHDTRGVFSFHAIPGIFGSIAAAVMAALATEDLYSYKLYALYPAMSPEADSAALYDVRSHLSYVKPGISRTAALQAVYQCVAIGTALAIGLLGGCITGFVLKLPILDPPSSKDLFNDQKYWDMTIGANESSGSEQYESYEHSYARPVDTNSKAANKMPENNK